MIQTKTSKLSRLPTRRVGVGLISASVNMHHISILVLLAAVGACSGFQSVGMRSMTKTRGSLKMFEKGSSTPLTSLSAEKKEEKYGMERLQDALEKADKDTKNKGRPPIYEPGSYPVHLLAALAYVIPIVDASDLGKYMFEAYPLTGAVYNSVFGAIAGVYNGVPFLPFAVFFIMSYICRAPSFPVEVRFHFAQAFMLSIIQFIPSLGFGLLEKGGVPGMGVLYNTVFLWVMASSVIMQLLLINPLAATKNPFLVNVVGWALRYMNYSPDMRPTSGPKP